MRGWDVVTTLEHFAIVTYSVDPDALARHLHPRFEPVLVEIQGAGLKGLISAVPFRDVDFNFEGLPRIRFAFGQTNYRAYVWDKERCSHAVWFFGTSLDSPASLIPRYVWKLPWHRDRIRFDCQFGTEGYEKYLIRTLGSWGGAYMELSDTGTPVADLEGFPDLETGLVVLTHPTNGFYFRRDGSLGSYSIWHPRLNPTVGACISADFDVYERLGLLSKTEQMQPYCVMIQNKTEFAVYLPPQRVFV